MRAVLLLLAPALALEDAAEIARRHAASAPTAVRALHARLARGLPSPRKPFVFFHLRKSAGTTMRQYLRDEVARARALSLYIPCYGGVPCSTYRLPSAGRRQPASIIAGHLYFAGVETALRTAANPRPTLQARRRANFSCFTILREPVSRVESCWNYRLEQHGVAKPFATLTAADIRAYLPSALDGYGFGCRNEPLRMFADGGEAEMRVNTATAAMPVGKWMLESALRNMATCFVGVLERCEETADVLVHAFPWLGRLPCSRRRNAYANSRTNANGTRTISVERALRRQTSLEQHTYAYANAMLDAELAHLRHQALTQPQATPTARRGQPRKLGRP
ncbi:hypothetical protein KFE25_007848 [Diacronema lutheri]|uniref:Sulfotransferase family protein n=1 Tax=Diacronema lutheri TaxID=2081491 RepID=A0A8J5Y109_DIALT|nr:hypothetical protein KFE25_007848 [Diacronema lutheri]